MRKKIDDLLDEYAFEHGLTKVQLAEEFGICAKTLFNIRKGRGMTLDTAYIVASHLGVTLDDLYTAVR